MAKTKKELMGSKSIIVYPSQYKEFNDNRKALGMTWSEFIDMLNKLLEKEGKQYGKELYAG